MCKKKANIFIKTFQGFSDEFLRKLDSISHSTGVYQMKYLLEKMLENKEVTTPDVVARSNVIVEGKYKPTISN